MCVGIKLLFAFLNIVAARVDKLQDSADGRCLLAKKQIMGRASDVQEDGISLLSYELHRDWRLRHRSLENAMNASKSLLDKFIDAQTESEDHCSSRLMESKRVLDGLLKDIGHLNDQVIGQEEVLETETENLKITKLAIDAVKKEYEKTVKECREETMLALDDLNKYTRELEELNQIAKPSIRYNHAVKVTVQLHQQDQQQDTDSLSLMEVNLDKQKCLAFVDFVKRHTHHKHGVLQGEIEPEKDCDTQRKELQKAFEEAYIATKKLKEEAKVRSEDTSCIETAEAKKTAELIPLVSQREVAVEKIESASQAIAALEPVLNLLKEKTEKLRKHIENTLTPECKTVGEASELLVRVREIIISLEECPGRNDFKLKIPSESADKEEATPTKAPEESEGNEEEAAPTEAPEESDDNEEEPAPTKAPEEPEGNEEEAAPTEAPAENESNEEAAPTKAPAENEDNEEEAAPTKAPEENEEENEEEMMHPNEEEEHEENDEEREEHEEHEEHEENDEEHEEHEEANNNEMSEENAEKAGGNEVPDMSEKEAIEAGGNEVPDMSEKEAIEAGGNEVPDIPSKDAEKAE